MVPRVNHVPQTEPRADFFSSLLRGATGRTITPLVIGTEVADEQPDAPTRWRLQQYADMSTTTGKS